MTPRQLVVQARVSPEEGELIARYAEETGVSVAALVRQLVLERAGASFIDAWSRSVSERNSPEGFTPHYRLYRLEPDLPGRLVVAVSCFFRSINGDAVYTDWVSMSTLAERDFMKRPAEEKLYLRGSGLWSVAEHFDVTPTPGAKPYAKLFLARSLSPSS